MSVTASKRQFQRRYSSSAGEGPAGSITRLLFFIDCSNKIAMLPTLMGRARSFDEAKILAGTAHLFRRLGFAATSLKDLEKATGLQAGSLYNAFGNKKSVFLRALDTYHTCVVRHRIQTYLKGNHFVQGLTKFFSSTYEVEGIPNAGCLLTNAAAEIGADDPEIQKKIEEGFSILRDAFAREVRHGQTQKLVARDTSPEAAAEFLLSAYQGLLVRVRNGTPATVLDEIVRMTIGAISLKKNPPKAKRRL
jgi:TetR/AcrR family transcriptional repressor of nem operon